MEADETRSILEAPRRRLRRGPYLVERFWKEMAWWAVVRCEGDQLQGGPVGLEEDEVEGLAWWSTC
ncbi:hypothetical protein Pyn_06160 [Prunus yedoensis var. nudiflora]|uniref:Uncharacterized protein n=1 Tax=Prunus yedoensis var. nudiflora TaxID=2094558 RepID=A0A314Z9S7_PRUYE|nr:hypothetical protein Pyn_06160 [Prunus yedoensis var. nudiflora]